jgi:hypothetical protein
MKIVLIISEAFLFSKYVFALRLSKCIWGFGDSDLFKAGILVRRNKKKLRGLSPRENYTDRATAASRRSDCQLLRIKDATWSA